MSSEDKMKFIRSKTVRGYRVKVEPTFRVNVRMHDELEASRKVTNQSIHAQRSSIIITLPSLNDLAYTS